MDKTSLADIDTLKNSGDELYVIYIKEQEPPYSFSYIGTMWGSSSDDAIDKLLYNTTHYLSDKYDINTRTLNGVKVYGSNYLYNS